MKWRDFETKSPSGLHCTNQYESSDHPMGQFSNRHRIRSITSTNPDRVRVSCYRFGSHEQVWNAIIRNQTHEFTRTQVYIRTHATYIYGYTPTYNYIHTYTSIHLHIHPGEATVGVDLGSLLSCWIHCCSSQIWRNDLWFVGFNRLIWKDSFQPIFNLYYLPRSALIPWFRFILN